MRSTRRIFPTTQIFVVQLSNADPYNENVKVNELRNQGFFFVCGFFFFFEAVSQLVPFANTDDGLGGE